MAERLAADLPNAIRERHRLDASVTEPAFSYSFDTGRKNDVSDCAEMFEAHVPNDGLRR